MKTAKEVLAKHKRNISKKHRSMLKLRGSIKREFPEAGNVDFNDKMHRFKVTFSFTVYEFEMFVNTLVISDVRNREVGIQEKIEKLEFGKKLFKQLYGAELDVKACNYWQDIELDKTGVKHPPLHKETSIF